MAVASKLALAAFIALLFCQLMAPPEPVAEANGAVLTENSF